MSENDGRKWYKLDNVAKIFPGSVKGADTRVFRIVCELNEPVDPEYLQQALDESLREFPYYNCVLRKGLFWYYLDGTQLRPTVEEDHEKPCAPIYFSGRRNLLYRVNYFENRINLEMFHVLADGTGAFRFLRRIVINYLRLAHSIPKEGRTDRSSVSEKTTDAFSKYYQSKKGISGVTTLMGTRAYQLKGPRDPNKTSHLIEGCVSVKKFLEVTHSYNTTAGVMITAFFIKAVLETMSVGDLKKPVIISVPVDLRQFFPSVTARNFFGVISVSYKAESLDEPLEKIVEAAAASFKEQLEKDRIVDTMNNYSTFERNPAIKFVPLFIKELGISGITFLTGKGVTATVSNLGKIELPEKLQDYVKQFSAFMAAPNMQVTIASYKDNMTFGFCSPFEDSETILNFFRILTDHGIEAVIASNDCDR